MNKGIKLDFAVHFSSGQSGQRVLNAGEMPEPPKMPEGRVPRLARLMALAIRFDDLVRSGELRDFAEIAELGRVTRARVSQIVNLQNLAPEIQEEILFLPPVQGERDTVSEREVRAIAAEPSWTAQRQRWGQVKKALASTQMTQRAKNAGNTDRGELSTHPAR